MPGSGVTSTFGVAQEGSWGAFTYPTEFVTFSKEGFYPSNKYMQAKILAGQLGDMQSRRVLVEEKAPGSITVPLISQTLGLLFKNTCGSVTSSNAGAVYTYHFVPASTDGLGLSVQVARATTNTQTLQPYSYAGCKVLGLDFSVKAPGFPELTFDLEGKSESTAASLSPPSYNLGVPYASPNASVTIGGTVSTTNGVSSLSGGSVLALSRDFSFKADNTVAQDRIFIGSLNIAEQLINGFRKYTGSMTLDFNGSDTFYNDYASGTPFPMQVTFQTANYINGSTYGKVNFLWSSVNVDSFKANVDGPQIIPESVNWTALYDGTNNQFQIDYITLDTTP